MRDLVQDRAYAVKIKQQGLEKQDRDAYLDWSLDVILEATERAIRAEATLAGDDNCQSAFHADKQ